MVRIVSLLFLIFVLYLAIQANKASTEKNILKEPSIITVEELPPIGT